MAFEHLLLFLASDIPDANAAIGAAATHKGLAIRAKGDGHHVVGVAQKGLEQFSGLHVPQLNLFIDAGAGKLIPIGRNI